MSIPDQPAQQPATPALPAPALPPPIVYLPNAERGASDGPTVKDHMMVRGFDRLLTTQRPVVLAHIRGIRRKHPNATPGDVIRILERRYLATITTGGAGVGAAAVVPGVGTMTSLALTSVETVVFLESTALFAQSVTELHGIAVTDPDRARTVVMALLLGGSGAELVKQLAAQATGKGNTRTQFWGEVIGRNVPQAFVSQIADRVQRVFVRRFAQNTGAGALGRLLPFGIGAVIGGTANHLLGRKVVNAARTAFPGVPPTFTANLEPRPPRPPKAPRAPKPVKDPARSRRALPALPSLPRLRKTPPPERIDGPAPDHNPPA